MINAGVVNLLQDMNYEIHKKSFVRFLWNLFNEIIEIEGERRLHQWILKTQKLELSLDFLFLLVTTAY